MLELLDSILAFSAIMLGVSLLITVLVQALAGFLNLRGWALAVGLTELLAQAKIDREKAAALAKSILTHPLISDSTVRRTWLSHWIQASAIRKEELLRLLASSKDLGLKVPDEVKDRLDQAQIIAKDWFDGQMDRVSQAFVLWTRVITVVVSFIVAFALHLDASILLQRMSSDPETRAKLVAGVGALEERAKRLNVVPSGDAAKNATLEVKAAADELKGLRADLATSGFDLLPKFERTANLKKSIHARGDYRPWTGEQEWNHFLGILAAGALLSLGAPFWFNLLKQLANLKTVVAKKEEAERTSPPAGASG